MRAPGEDQHNPEEKTIRSVSNGVDAKPDPPLEVAPILDQYSVWFRPDYGNLVGPAFGYQPAKRIRAQRGSSASFELRELESEMRFQ